MAELITTAGVAVAGPNAGAPNPKREAVRAIRAVLRRQESTDDEVDDALEALLELGKLPE